MKFPQVHVHFKDNEIRLNECIFFTWASFSYLQTILLLSMNFIIALSYDKNEQSIEV